MNGPEKHCQDCAVGCPDSPGCRDRSCRCHIRREMDRDIEQTRARIKSLVAELDALLGTPCEQIRARHIADDHDSWEANARVLLDGTPSEYAVRVREGGGLEDLKASLVVTYAKMRDALAAFSSPNTERTEK